MSDSEDKVLSYPNRPDLRNVTVEEVAKQSEKPGPSFDYPSRQPGAKQPAVYHVDGTLAAPNTTGLDLLARKQYLAGVDLTGLKAENYLIAENRNLSSSSMKDILLRNVRVRDWNLQRSEISGRVEGSDCRGWDLRNARTTGLSFVRCSIDGMRGAPRKSLINCTGIPESYDDE